MALLRAAWQWASSGRVVSGGSTLTMQVARILEPHPEGSTSGLLTAVYPQFMSLAPLQKLRFEGFTKTTTNILNKYLYPNMDKILVSLNYLPGFSGKRKKLAAGDAEERQRKTVAFDEMIEDFYRLRDIDGRGRPSRGCLEGLGLADVAAALHG